MKIPQTEYAKITTDQQILTEHVPHSGNEVLHVNKAVTALRCSVYTAARPERGRAVAHACVEVLG